MRFIFIFIFLRAKHHRIKFPVVIIRLLVFFDKINVICGVCIDMFRLAGPEIF